MGKSTGIAWTDHTFNPWWGCARVSDGCLHCYAESAAARYGHAIWGKSSPRRFMSDKHWRQPELWNAAAEAAGQPALVFCASMADVFEDRPDLVLHRARLFDLIRRTPWLRWQLLTKRPENVLDLVPVDWTRRTSPALSPGFPDVHLAPRWPSNCWIGTTVEHQHAATERIPILQAIPAPVRFLSCEPLLGFINLAPWLTQAPAGIHWVIVGGESGPGFRPMELAAARYIVSDCEDAGVPVFFKQVGGTKYVDGVAGGDLLDGRRIKQFPPEAERDRTLTLRA